MTKRSLAPGTQQLSEKHYKNHEACQEAPGAEAGARSAVAADHGVAQNVDRLAQLMGRQPAEQVVGRNRLPGDSKESVQCQESATAQDRRVETSEVNTSGRQQVVGSAPTTVSGETELAPAGRVSGSVISLLVFFGGGGMACSLFTTAGNNLIAGFALGMSVVGALLLRVFLRG